MRAATRSALLRAAALALPAPGQIGLLEAVLGPDPCVAWRRWAGALPDPLATLSALGARTLLPLLDHALGACAADLAPGVRDGLRASALAERTRAASYDRIAAGVLVALRGHRVLVLKGAALAALVYPDRRLRHCHDIDLVVDPADGPAVDEAVRAAGFTRGPGGAFLHRSGLPLRVHPDFFAIMAFRLTFDEVWAHRVQAPVGGVEAETPSAAHALVQACGHASYWHGPESLRWVADAMLLIRSETIDWEAVVHAVREGGLAVPLSMQMDFLEGTLGAPVPGVVRNRLRAMARQSPDADVRAAALGAVGASPRRLLDALAAAGPRAAPSLLRDALAPPAALAPLRLGARHRWSARRPGPGTLSPP